MMPAGELVTVPVPVPVRLTLRTLCVELKFAVTVRAAPIVTLQMFPEVESQPVQPVKAEFTSAVAVRVTGVPSLYVAEQVVGQLMPAGELVTVPVPVPVRLTVRVFTVELKVAVTLCAALIVTVQVPVPVQSPLQPAKVELTPAVGVSVTTAPLLKEAEHVEGQLMPAGLLVTFPVPSPAVVTVRAKFVVPPDGARATPRKVLLVPALAIVAGLPVIVALYPAVSVIL